MKEILIQKLIHALNYSEHTALQTADDLLRINHNDIKRALKRWIFNDETIIITQENFSTNILMHEYGMTYPAALIFVDWYREDPSTAIEAIHIRM